MHTEGPLLQIENCLWDIEEYELASDSPPRDVIVKAGEWLKSFGNNRSVCQHIGDIRPFAHFMAGKRRGSWALSMALALNQIWRQDALNIDLERFGNAENATTVFKKNERVMNCSRCFRQPQALLRLLMAPTRSVRGNTGTGPSSCFESAR